MESETMTQVNDSVVLPEPDFELRWHSKDARYTVSKPNIGDTSCYTADTVRALLATAHAPAADALDAALTQAARDVLAERARQISAEGYDPGHDDEHGDGSLSIAAACYALANVPGARPGALSPSYLATWVGWGSGWFKPSTRRRNLEKACALLLAEMERIDRAAITAQAAAKEGAT